MKSKKSYVIFLFFLLFFLGLMNVKPVEGITNSLLQTDQEQYQIGETINLTLKLDSLKCAAMEGSFYYDASQLEYIAGPENVNVLENEIKFTWYDEEGGVSPSNHADITLEFMAKKEGKASIALNGNFYDGVLKEVVVPTQSIVIEIGEEKNNERQEVITEEEGTKQNSQEQSNAKLLSLRISEEGLSPYFSPEEKNYMFVTEKEITSLDITAIPQNPEATVHVQGNQNFVLGRNVITIEVLSQDKTQKEEYTIEVIRTNHLEKANANLETLAIEGTILYPSYDNQINQYTAEVANSIQNLNLLAIPENSKTQVTIKGKDDLKVGDNIVSIFLLAEDGITDREVIIKVHRRSEEEQISYEENQKIEAQRLETILREEEQEKSEETLENGEEGKMWVPFVAILLFAIILLVSLILWDKAKRKKRTQKEKEREEKKK